ncbi:MAG: hypothetical protein ACRDJW_19590, partial [Thermomicrobiales bacterium]
KVERTLSTGGFAFPEDDQQLDLFGDQQRTSSPQEAASSPQEAASSPQEKLLVLAAPVRNSRTAPKHVVEAVILALCEGRFLTPQELSALLNRNPETLRNHYLGRMVRENRLTPKYPETLSHPKQAYTTRDQQ